ncbi:cyclic nucleotide-binding domain-containing protein [Treponema pallidum]|uniref:CAP family transcription factor n=1 Tax=Treponema pallidum subsp. pertenue (strain Gauthier) TaxID=491080 RepID=A0AAU8PM89_TREPG|nr:cyclic nucleotide-binding domain-containing protein [Treponema pallidum]ADD73086.1 cyclic nucleotide binding protein [Treponema pallidum subsp. pallidum str. Chicago]AEZ58138.1 putative CAP family transcription factor [Treponema pallidum subsp. pertenue str. SamoaD]AEZ59206.1 putative CAP family transcription factor [Treponema pallidum subsp. pertenue str. CDC2]AEZ60274.1 putative CAP family transcription factor [Treponema pallidum subsp. pertenue str. Gauthier]AEZ61333.1 putative CAP famil
MSKIPLISTVTSTISAINGACTGERVDIHIQTLSRLNEIASVFRFEMPEIKIIDFGDPNVDSEACLKIIKDDPWLLFGGVIAITNSMEEKIKIVNRKDPNFLSVSTRQEFEAHASQVVRIVDRNRHFLSSRSLVHQAHGHEQGNFICDTDSFEITFYASLISSYLYNTNRINELERTSFEGAMMELLLNALEHGNCGISYDEKTEWLEQRKDIFDLIALRKQDPRISAKKIYISYDITLQRTRITIRDEGTGFDWKSRMASACKPGLHGMGIKMTEIFVKRLSYNDVGNEVTFEIDNQENVANLVPSILKNQQVLTFRDAQVVCYQNEESSSLFYISSGKFAVYVDNKFMSMLTPSDIFIGEMSFLLNNRRSATIVSVGEGTLVKISKMKFISLIEDHPHYGIYLARLLAGRLAHQSRESAKLKNTLTLLGQRTPDTGAQAIPS